QAEDGIRDFHVTGVQTCALPIYPMNHGGSWDFEFGRLKYVNAIHTSSFPDGSYGGQPGGFVIESEHKNIYIAGDTALTMDMKLIDRKSTRLNSSHVKISYAVFCL